MCNLYNTTTPVQAIRDLFGVTLGAGMNLPPLPEIYPKMDAPVVRPSGEGRELTMMRWGFPPPPSSEKKGGNRPVTNVRNLSSPFWRNWIARNRCLVPVTAFCEWTDSRPKQKVWFRLKDAEAFAFAGIWRPVQEEGGETAEVMAFLTTAPNTLVAPVHAKAMPVIVAPQDYDAWLSAPAIEAVKLARPFSPKAMEICEKPGA